MRAVLFSAIFIVFLPILRAQAPSHKLPTWRDSLPIKRHKIGFDFGHSFHPNYQVIGRPRFRSRYLLARPYYFHIRLYQLQYAYTFYRPSKNTTLEMLLQPQFNTARYSRPPADSPRAAPATITRDAIEFGVNIGLIGRWMPTPKFYAWNIYGLISAGPHYVSGTPNYQTPGFIFSTNLALGLGIPIYKGWSFDFRVNWRHMSTATLRRPNLGIEHLLLNYGFLWNFSGKRKTHTAHHL